MQSDKESRKESMTAEALAIGAYEQKHKYDLQGWQPIETAPRDGTVIEIKNIYGVAPWYGLYQWTDELVPLRSKKMLRRESPTWMSIDRQTSLGDESHLYWRPYNGDPQQYVDPTNGVQTESAYWRGAVANERGLPLNYFESNESFLVRFYNWGKSFLK